MINDSKTYLDIHKDARIWEAALGLLKLTRYKTFNQKYGRQVRKTKFQTKVLDKVFSITRFPSTASIIDLALLINIHPKSIQKWFQNTRQVTKKKEGGTATQEEPNVFDIPIRTLVLILNNTKKEETPE